MAESEDPDCTATVELRRLKSAPLPDVTLAPQTVAMQRLLPEDFLRERKYDIGKVVAQGGMGAILDAREATTERRVAMKVMLDGSSPDDLSRFISEAKVTAQLEHSNVVPLSVKDKDPNSAGFLGENAFAVAGDASGGGGAARDRAGRNLP